MAPTDRGGSSEDPTLYEVASLPVSERRVLAALAVVGKASLSTEELAFLAQIEDAGPVVADLRRRGMVATDERDRHRALGTLGEEIRRTNEALETGDRLRAYMETLARGGKLTPARLVEDAEAILGLTEWTAELEQWASLLELVQAVEASFSVAEHVEQYVTLLQAGWGAARVLGDRAAEVAMLQRLASASRRLGDEAAAQRYQQQANDLLRPPAQMPAGPPPPRTSSGAKIALAVGGFLATAVLGLAAGYLIAGNGGNANSTTALIPVTLSLPGQTVVTVQTATLPAETVLSTVLSTVIETETVVTTATVVVTTPALTTIG